MMQGSKFIFLIFMLMLIMVVPDNDAIAIQNLPISLQIDRWQPGILILLVFTCLVSIWRIVLLRNISQHLRMQNTELLLAKQKAERANENKSEFLSKISHEIRTPLNAIIGFTKLLRKTRNSKTEKHQLGLIDHSANQLQQLIEDLLDLSRLEAAQVELHESTFNLREMLDETLEILYPQYSHYPVMPIPIIEHSTDIKVKTDVTKLRQIIVNLTSNAIKYTTSGHIVLRIEFKKDQLVFQITDTGVGMTKQQVEQLFEPFVRHHEQTLEVSGTGLGMAITRHLLSLMQAEININSAVGEGTSIQIKMPVKTIRTVNEPSKKLNNIVVLYSDPFIAEALHQTSLCLAVKSECYTQVTPKVFETHSDLWLIEHSLWCALGKTKRDLLSKQTVILIHMPNAAELLINQNKKKDKIQKQLTFPVSLTQLKGQMVYPKTKTQYIALVEEPIQLQAPILVVDDNPVNLEFMERLLDDLGLASIPASSGIEALRLIQKHRFSFIFMDIRMPMLDGVETRQEIIKQLGEEAPPIIALTANAMHGESSRYQKMGFDEYLSKPVSSQNIKACVLKLNPSNKGQYSGLNWATSLKIAGDDEQIAQDILGKLLLELPELICHLQQGVLRLKKEIQKGLEKELGEQFDTEYIHKVLGLISYTGAEKLKSQLSEIESQLRATQEQCSIQLIDEVILEANQVLAQGLNKVKQVTHETQKTA